MAKSKEQLLDEMLDREAIRDLAVRYCDYIWRDEVSQVVDTFTADGAFISAPPAGVDAPAQEARGKAEILRVLGGGITGLKPRPYIHNHTIDLLGNGRARGRVYVELRSPAVQMEWIGTGYYEDEYLKVAGEWKFQSRTVRMLRFAPPPR
jgi:alkyl sulfatase BDS1-like metallo-beta-lactamase superfamily hydrolase